MSAKPLESFIDHCDNCKQEPQGFMAGASDGKEVQCFYHIIPNKVGEDPVVLMSNLEFAFKLCPTKHHPVLKDELFLCSKCFDTMFSVGDAE